MQSPSVSVIVPIYKTERFIKRCLQSLFEQTLSDIEYIFVNDCTPDKSMEILSEVLNTSYSHKKPQVKIVSHDKNRGASVARNSGLSAATGQYVIFADSDDWVKQDAYAMMYEKAVKHDYDIIWSDYYINESETETYKSQYFNPCKTDCIRALLSGSMHGGPWNKLVRRNLYTDHGISFTDGLLIWEDMTVNIKLFYVSNRIGYLSEGCYHYVRYNADSITQSCNGTFRTQHMIHGTEEIDRFLSAQNDLGLFEKELSYRKLFAKAGLLVSSDKEIAEQWRLQFPESHKYILSAPMFSFRFKVLQWTVAHDWWLIYKIYNWLNTHRRSFH